VSLRLAVLLALALALPAGAAPKTVCGLPVQADAALSPDGKLAAFIRQEPTGDPDPEYANAGALWLRDCRTGHESRLMPAIHVTSDNNGWSDLDSPVFSLDGRVLYVSGAPGADYLTIFRVDPTTGKYAVVAHAELFGIMRTGPYRGDILATQHTALYSKVDQDGYGGYPYYIFDPQGRVLRYIGGSQTWDDKRLRRWLKGQGWQVSWAGELTP
jgi:hypothetical protein